MALNWCASGHSWEDEDYSSCHVCEYHKRIAREAADRNRDTKRLDWLEKNWLGMIAWITPLEPTDFFDRTLWSTESKPGVGGFQEIITDSLRLAIDSHMEQRTPLSDCPGDICLT